MSVAILALSKPFLASLQPCGSLSAILGFASAPLWLTLDPALSAMPTYYSKTLVDNVDELLTTPADKQSIITSWKKILQLLFEGNVVKPEKQLIHCKYILCHPKKQSRIHSKWIQCPGEWRQCQAHWR